VRVAVVKRRQDAMKLFEMLGAALVVATGAQAATTIDATNAWAYGANVGWINWRGDVTHGAVVGQYVCAGVLYSGNVGWINLGSGAPQNRIRYGNSSATDFGVNHDGAGKLEGYAWGPNIGWISFTNRTATGAVYDGPRVDLLTGKLRGYVWSGNVGWISLSNALAFVQTIKLEPGADTDGDGLPDAWELEHFGDLVTADGTSDYDGDGATDLQEYLAGTDPRQAGSNLHVTSFARGAAGASLNLSWQSRPDRQYRIMSCTGLFPTAAWADVGVGLISPDPSGTTSQSIRVPGGTSRFYRIEAINPLGP
jgi:hypothetical protein